MSQTKAWIDQYAKELGSRESVSGYGSSLENTIEIREALPEIIRLYGITSIVDVPCGDWNWMQHVKMPSVYYVGCDIVPDMVADNIKKFGSSKREFRVLDIVKEVPPSADLILCRDFLFHLPNASALKVIENIRKSGCQFVLTTYFPKIKNADILNDACIRWRKINICASPFNFPEPEYIIQENDSEACQGRVLGLFRTEAINGAICL